VVVVSADSSFRHRENNITSVLEETFSVVEDRFGEHVVVESNSGRAALPKT
jgi:hypothetical protein